MDFWNTYIFSPGGFLITILTLILSLRINYKVNSAIDTHEFKMNQSDISDRLNQFIQEVTEKKLSESKTSQLRSILYQLSADYPSIVNKKEIKEVIDNIHHYITAKEINTDNMLKNLIVLEARLRREVR